MKVKGLICLMLLLACLTAKGYDFQQDGIYYNILSDKTSVEVTITESVSGSYTGNVVIPASVTHDGVTYKVTQIGDAAFFKCGGLTSVTIPESVTFIATSAFYECTGLKSISLPDSIEFMGAHVFAKCSNLESIKMPAKIQYVWKEYFLGCSSLTEITFPSMDNFVRLEYDVFKDCKKLKSIYIPKAYKKKVTKMLPKRLWKAVKVQ